MYKAEAAQKLWESIPDKTDILITHGIERPLYLF